MQPHAAWQYQHPLSSACATSKEVTLAGMQHPSSNNRTRF